MAAAKDQIRQIIAENNISSVADAYIDFAPFSIDNKRGLETKNSLQGALASGGFESEGKDNTEWQQWSKAEAEDIAIIMEKYGVG